MAELLPQVDSDDMLEFGLIPELVGRLPVISALKPLDTAALVRVLTRAKKCLGQAISKVVWHGRMPICSSPKTALQAIARRAQEKDTGARGLRSIIEEVMLDIMFDLPEHPGARYVITETNVSARERIFPLVEEKKNSA